MVPVNLPDNRTRMLILLTMVYMFSVLDRQIMAVLLQPIKDDLHLSDTQLGFLSGTAFALFYATLGIPLGRYADRCDHRNKLIAGALALFSVMTIASGLAFNFISLLMARIGVAVGEAGTSPPSHSMISDVYAPFERAKAMAVQTTGANFAVVIGFAAGGILAEIYGWRVAFMVVGGAGACFALLLLFYLVEPPRGSDGGIVGGGRMVIPSLPVTLGFLWEQRSFRHTLAGSSLALFLGLGVVSWLPSYFHRSFNVSVRDAGIMLGLAVGVGSGVGVLISGYLADYLGKRDIRWRLYIISLAGLITFPLQVCVFLADTKGLALWAMVVPAMTIIFFQAPAFALAQELSQMRMRATTSAIVLFVINLIGLGLGPQLVGVLSDFLMPEYGAESLRYALLAVTPVGLWASVHFYLASRMLPEDIAHARAMDAQSI